jgi:hypothetical protein
MTASPDVVVLFSGGLDSLLTAKLLQQQGLVVRCWHAVSPFFGKTGAVDFWHDTYGLDVHVEDVGGEFVAMLRQGPLHGFGKVLNPCVDCKIHLLRKAARYMKFSGATALASGEVTGQRPMSQRRDIMRVIAREAGVADILLRPLSAGLLEPTLPEKEGLVDRSRLASIAGRGRTGQLALAARFGITAIPTPGGGCRLTERENARRYWPLFKYLAAPDVEDFNLANLGRQFWGGSGDSAFWLSVGRNEKDNVQLAGMTRPDDALLTLRALPGPTALARGGCSWPLNVLRQAAQLTAACSPKAVASSLSVEICVKNEKNEQILMVKPERGSFFSSPPPFVLVREERGSRFRALHH